MSGTSGGAGGGGVPRRFSRTNLPRFTGEVRVVALPLALDNSGPRHLKRLRETARGGLGVLRILSQWFAVTGRAGQLLRGGGHLLRQPGALRGQRLALAVEEGAPLAP